MNSDGKPDLIGYTNLRIEVFLGNGTLALGSSIVTDVGAASDLVFGDLNGDGHLDIVTGSSTAVAVDLGHGDGTFAAPIIYESGGGRGSITLADVEADGRVDIIVDDEGGYANVLRGRCL